MIRLTKNERVLYEHIKEKGHERGFTFGRGRPYDKGILDRLLRKNAVTAIPAKSKQEGSRYTCEPLLSLVEAQEKARTAALGTQMVCSGCGRQMNEFRSCVFYADCDCSWDDDVCDHPVCEECQK